VEVIAICAHGKRYSGRGRKTGGGQMHQKGRSEKRRITKRLPPPSTEEKEKEKGGGRALASRSDRMLLLEKGGKQSQPRLPSDLGFYDLRLRKGRRKRERRGGGRKGEWGSNGRRVHSTPS